MAWDTSDGLNCIGGERVALLRGAERVTLSLALVYRPLDWFC